MIGQYGNITFEVSSDRINSFEGFTRNVTSRYTNHQLIGQKPRTEFVGPALDTISFTVILKSQFGVKPRDEMNRWLEYARCGNAEILVIGGQPLGVDQWVVTSVSQHWDTIFNNGELISGKVKICLQEYVSTMWASARYHNRLSAPGFQPYDSRAFNNPPYSGTPPVPEVTAPPTEIGEIVIYSKNGSVAKKIIGMVENNKVFVVDGSKIDLLIYLNIDPHMNPKDKTYIVNMNGIKKEMQLEASDGKIYVEDLIKTITSFTRHYVDYIQVLNEGSTKKTIIHIKQSPLEIAKLWINGSEKQGAFISEGKLYYPDLISVKALRDEAQQAKAEDCLSWWKENRIIHATYNPDMKSAPVKLQRTNDIVDVTINLAFYGDIANDYFVEIDSAGNKMPLTKTYAETALDGIKREWCANTFYPDKNNNFGDDKSITVNFTINLLKNTDTTPHLRIKIEQSGQPICWYNVLWNINGKQNSSAFSDITLCAFFEQHVWENAFKNQAAHELGHTLGLGDAYNGTTQQGPSTTDTNVLSEVPLNEIMRSGWNDVELNANTVEMILEAFKTNKLQKFDPRDPSDVIRSY